jgi:hypothetical protein
MQLIIDIVGLENVRLLLSGNIDICQTLDVRSMSWIMLKSIYVLPRQMVTELHIVQMTIWRVPHEQLLYHLQ